MTLRLRSSSLRYLHSCKCCAGKSPHPLYQDVPGVRGIGNQTASRILGKVMKSAKNGKGPGLSKMISERSRSRVQSQICTYGSQHFFCVKAKLILIIEGWKTLMWPVCCLRYRIYSMYHSMCSCSSIIPTTQMRRGLMWDEALIALIQPFTGFSLWIGSCRCKCKSHQLRSWQRPS